MTQRDEGGSAFPHKTWSDAYTEHAASSGMSLRDWFAGQALPQIMPDGRVQSYSHAATEAYKMADAMLEARK